MLVFCAFQGNVIATELATGSRVWQYKTTGGTRRLAVDGGQVFALDHPSLARLDEETGREIWKATAPKHFYGDTLLVTGDAAVIGGNGAIACFDRATGTLRWHDELKGMGSGPVALAVRGNVVQADVQ